MAKASSPRHRKFYEQEINWQETWGQDRQDVLRLLKNEAQIKNEHIQPSGDCDNNVFCHPVVFAAFSGHAQRAFKLDHKFLEIIFTDVSLHVLIPIIEWMYSDIKNICMLADEENLAPLFTAALDMDVPVLLQQLDKLMNHQSNSLLLLPLMKVFRMKSSTNRMKSILSKVCDQANQVLDTEEFVKLDLEDVVTIWKQDELGVHNEIEVFLSVVLWLNEEWGARKQYTVKTMECVRFIHIRLMQLVSIQRDYPILMETERVKKMVQDAIHYRVIYNDRGGNSQEMKKFLKGCGMVVSKMRSSVIDFTVTGEDTSEWSYSTLCSKIASVRL